MSPHLRTVPTLLTTLVLLAGCPTREVARVDPAQSKEQQKTIPVDNNRNLDILFVIDNSGSMSEEQASLSANFVSFINVLRNVDGGLPNVHLGVVSTDMGGPQSDTACSTSDNGELVTNPAFTGNYIIDIDDGNGNGGRTTNYNGTLESAFSAAASLGTGGCGFEQPLRAMRTALESPSNAGFIREDAYLAIIFITDEDDCSVTDNAMFGTQCDTIDSSCSLGPLHSYRCFEFGVQCDPDRPRDTGSRHTADCAPRDDSPYMATPDDFADFLRGFKNPNLIFTAGIIAPPDEQTIVNLIERTAGNGTPLPDALELEPSCTGSAGSGFPGIRLQSFFSEFPTRSVTTTICNDDLTDALVQIAGVIVDTLPSPCLSGDIQTDPVDCTVADVRFSGQPEEQRDAPMPTCSDPTPDPSSNTSSTKPCYFIAEDPSECDTQTNLKLTIIRESDPPIGTDTNVRCVAN